MSVCVQLSRALNTQRNATQRINTHISFSIDYNDFIIISLRQKQMYKTRISNHEIESHCLAHDTKSTTGNKIIHHIFVCFAFAQNSISKSSQFHELNVSMLRMAFDCKIHMHSITTKKVAWTLNTPHHSTHSLDIIHQLIEFYDHSQLIN